MTARAPRALRGADRLLLAGLALLLARPTFAPAAEPCTCTVDASVPGSARAGETISVGYTVTPSGDCDTFRYSFKPADGYWPSEVYGNPFTTSYGAGSYHWKFLVTHYPSCEGYCPPINACLDEGDITVADACSFACGATVPASASLGATASFRAAVATEGCFGAVQYRWTWGDGSQSDWSSDPVANHAYSAFGPKTWTLEAILGPTYAPEKSCQTSGTISIEAPRCFDPRHGLASAADGGVPVSEVCADSYAVLPDGSEVYQGNLTINGVLSLPGNSRLIVTGTGDEHLLQPDLAIVAGGRTLFASTDFNLTVNLATGVIGTTLEYDDGERVLVEDLGGLPVYFNDSSVMSLSAGGLYVQLPFYVGEKGQHPLARCTQDVHYGSGGRSLEGDPRCFMLQNVIQVEIFDPVLRADTDTYRGTLSLTFPRLDRLRLEADFEPVQVTALGKKCINTLTPKPPVAGPFRIYDILAFADATLSATDLCTDHPEIVLGLTNLGLADAPADFFHLDGVDAVYPVEDPPDGITLLPAAVGSLNLFGDTTTQADPPRFLGAMATTQGGQGFLRAKVRGAGLDMNTTDWELKGDLDVTVSGSVLASLTGEIILKETLPCFKMRKDVEAVCHLTNLLLVVKRGDPRETPISLPVEKVPFYGRSRSGGRWFGWVRIGVRIDNFPMAILWLKEWDGGTVSEMYGMLVDNVALGIPPGGAKRALATVTSRTVTLAGNQPLVLGAVGADLLPALSLRTPEGAVITPATTADFPGVAHAQDPATRTALFFLENAWPGTWILEVANLPEDKVSWAAFGPSREPTASFTRVAREGTAVEMDLASALAGEGTTVDFFFTRSQGGLPEGVIDLEVPAADGTASAVWETAGVPSGSYWLLAVVNQPDQVPLTVRHPEELMLDQGVLAPPSDLQGSRDATTATLSWRPSPSPGVTGYRILVSDQPEVWGTTSRQDTPRTDGGVVGGLDPTRSYRFAVQAFDAAGHFSLTSSWVLLAPETVRIVRRFASHEVTSLPVHVQSGYGLAPVLSGDGRRMAFTTVSYGPGASRLMVADADGANLRELDAAANTSGFVPDISADGTLVAGQNGGTLRLAAADGSFVRTLVALQGVPRTMRLAGDGSAAFLQIVYDTALPDGTPVQRGIWTVSADGTGFRQVVGPAQVATLLGVAAEDVWFGVNGTFCLDVSRDASRVVFGAGATGKGHLPLAVNADGTGLHLLDLVSPEWPWVDSLNHLALSGDGTTVLFDMTPHQWWVNPNRVGVIGFDGSGRRYLATNTGGVSGSDERQQLSSDGSRLLLGSSGLLYATDGSGVLQLGILGEWWSGFPRALVGDGLWHAVMDGSAGRFLFVTSNDAGIHQLATLDLDPPFPGAAPVIVSPSLSPPWLRTDGAPGIVYRARVEIPAGSTAPVVNGAVLLDGRSDPRVGSGVMVDDGNGNDETAGDHRHASYTRWCSSDVAMGPRTVRIKAENRVAGLRHAAAVEFAPFEIVSQLPATDVTGRITFLNGSPAPGVTVSAGGGRSDATAADGTWLLTGVPYGTYTLVPTREGYLFSPPTRQVTVPPAPASQDFVADAPPVVFPLADQRGVEGSRLSFTVPAWDPGGQALIYDSPNLPAGATVSGGTFSWTPGYDQAGDYPGVTLTASDGALTASRTVRITVADTNRPPTLSPLHGLSGVEGVPLRVYLVGDDPDGDGLRFSGVNLPEGAAVDPDSGLFSWTPWYDQSGTYPEVRFRVTDTGTPPLEDSEGVPLSIADATLPLLTDSFASGLRKWRAIAGRWTVAKGVLNSNREKVNLLTAADFDGDHPIWAGELRVKVKLTSSFRKEANGAVLFGCRGKSLHRSVTLKKGLVQIAQTGSDGGADTPGVQAQAKAAVAVGKWVTLTVRFHPDGLVEVRLGSKVVLSHRFAEVWGGGVGLGASYALTSFDDVRLLDDGALP